MNELELTGQARSHVVELSDPRCMLHYEAVASFLAMRDAARDAGIDLTPRSSFRDFQAQLGIWNRKWSGERPIYDRQGALLDRKQLPDSAAVDAILCWSAIPGGSRHHWGSDVDVIDAAAVPPGYTVELLPAEYAPEGIFGRLSQWLDANMRRFGFYRPYRTDRGGVSPEPWHLSYAPISQPALESLSLSTLRRVLEASNIEGKPHVLARLPEIYTRFLLAVDTPS
ncbi:carboxypeptidase [Steroidobacter agaridevorans]|uniref:Carboxypeptidase n=1 Tax=Steroidobacter agaridevorans TaxID=2695856 RepID=A0A829Y4V3_9GAMM|nr:M15 family metallopeptidase [Steroidobacter agaridevorans]GFE78025.1 carboxypeptidase [Steroidobacter agaridevorans]GFE91084.1 carboxypeptidase [Steroidobacter agaridevorans]